MKINIVDSIMGSGKTSYFIKKMNEDDENNYIYITPYLNEIKRIKQSVTTKRFYEPNNYGNGKQDNLHELIIKNKNIASTHALFKASNEETINLLKANSYILVLDEVMDVLEQINIKKDDIDLLISNNIISIDKEHGNLVVWNEDKMELDTMYNYLKKLCLNKNVFFVNNTLLMWTFPIEIFKAFKEVYVLTYMFKGQIQRYYYDLYNIDYEYKSIHNINGEYVLGNYIDNYDLTEIKSKINILDDKINVIGEEEYSLSKAWYKKNKNKLLIVQLQKNIENYFKNKINGKSSENMWTTFKEYKGKLQGRGYTKGYIPLNARATNDFCDKFNLAYCANRYLNPIIKQFFIERGVEVNEDIYALSELLQCIWRSRIRNGGSINLYIPSLRMRTLLTDWLDGKIK